MTESLTETAEIVAVHVTEEFALNAANPASVWSLAGPVKFSHDWKGENPDDGRETTARVLWSQEALYLRFDCRYREIFVFEDSDPNGRRDFLWDRDVAEVFLQPDPSRERYYKEFEVAPNGMWVDLDIFPGGRSDLRSGLQRSVFLDEQMNDQRRTWAAELAIPMKCLTSQFDPSAIWRANFYRVEGAAEPRAYMAWQPTRTPEPNFHVPGSFGRLRFDG